MTTNFINSFSFKCLLGPQSHNIEIIGPIAKWKVGKNKIKTHIANLGVFDSNDVSFIKGLGPVSFHYMMPENIDILKKAGLDIGKVKLNSTLIELDKLNYVGREYHGIRGAINKNAKLGLSVQSTFNNLSDVEEMIEEWSNNYTDNYFRDFSGKNYFFYKSGFHLGCQNTFIYDNDKLIAFACLSPGENSSYIIGKALFKSYPGLSEFADNEAYKKAAINETKIVNLGQSKGNIAIYKNKFPGSYSILHYDGAII